MPITTPPVSVTVPSTTTVVCDKVWITNLNINAQGLAASDPSASMILLPYAQPDGQDPIYADLAQAIHWATSNFATAAENMATAGYTNFASAYPAIVAAAQDAMRYRADRQADMDTANAALPVAQAAADAANATVTAAQQALAAAQATLTTATATKTAADAAAALPDATDADKQAAEAADAAFARAQTAVTDAQASLATAQQAAAGPVAALATAKSNVTIATAAWQDPANPPLI